jgi:hypothetical protein
MRQLFLALLSFASINLLAQTKEIAFKSHSGNMDNFKIALENDFFGSEKSDFGLPSPVETYLLDSVIYISEKMSVVVKKVFRREYNEPKDSTRFLGVYKDTVYNDPLFSKKHSLDSIRNVLKNTGFYSNLVNKVVFIGYDNKKGKAAKKGKNSNEVKLEQNIILPVIINDNSNNNNSPFDPQLVVMLGSILALALLGGWMSWKLYQPRLQKA